MCLVFVVIKAYIFDGIFTNILFPCLNNNYWYKFYVTFSVFNIKRRFIFTVTRTCSTRYTNVFRSLHECVTPVTRTCNAKFEWSFLHNSKSILSYLSVSFVSFTFLTHSYVKTPMLCRKIILKALSSMTGFL